MEREAHVAEPDVRCLVGVGVKPPLHDAFGITLRGGPDDREDARMARGDRGQFPFQRGGVGRPTARQGVEGSLAAVVVREDLHLAGRVDHHRPVRSGRGGDVRCQASVVVLHRLATAKVAGEPAT